MPLRTALERSNAFGDRTFPFETSEVSLQPSWTECIILNTDKTRTAYAKAVCSLTDLKIHPPNSFQMWWRHYVGWNRSVTGSLLLLLTARAKWILNYKRMTQYTVKLSDPILLSSRCRDSLRDGRSGNQIPVKVNFQHPPRLVLG